MTRSLLFASAVLVALASSPPVERWIVQDSEKLTDTLGRDTLEASYAVDLYANDLTFSMAQAVEPEVGEPGEPRQLVRTDEIVAPFSSAATVQVRAKNGKLGADDTDVTVQLVDALGEVVDEQTLFVGALDDDAYFDLMIPDVFAHCELNEGCYGGFDIEVRSSQPTKLTLKLEVRANVEGQTEVTEEPEDAYIDVDIERIASR